MLTSDASKSPLTAPAWPILLVAAACAATPVFACVTPFAAIAVLAALTLSRRAALATVGAAWLGNQLIGCTLLHYPLTANTMVLGLSLAAGAFAIVPLAEALNATIRLRRPLLVPAATALLGFALYELITYLFSLGFGGRETFTAPLTGEVFAINAMWGVALGACFAAIRAAEAVTIKALIRR